MFYHFYDVLYISLDSLFSKTFPRHKIYYRAQNEMKPKNIYEDGFKR